jgi:hypothetical protein
LTNCSAASGEHIIAQFKAARRVSTPLVAITTPDPAATIDAICGEINSNAPKIVWDVCNGLSHRNSTGKAVIAEIVGSDMDPTEGNPVECCRVAARMPEGTLLFVMNAQHWIESPPFVQAVWNLRDQFKSDQRTLVLLCPNITLPPELSSDVFLLEEPLPDPEQISAIVHECHEVAGLSVDDDTTTRAIAATQGLRSAYEVEQLTAMSLSPDGLDVDNLWERKRQEIERTGGLRVYRSAEKFSDVGGVEAIIQYIEELMQGPPDERPNAVIWIDEIEKMMSGATGDVGDTSGTSQDQLGVLLQYLENEHACGLMFVGPPGSAKSMVAKAAGDAGGVPTIALDLGGMKASLVGQSEQRIRDALKTITAISAGKTLWIATCNKISKLPPELRRRFTLGTFFFDLPTAEERALIWEKQLAAHGLEPVDTEAPGFIDDRQWTGAEIKACIEVAIKTGRDLVDAAKYIVPAARQMPEALDALRKLADNCFLSASYEGEYQRDRTANTPTTRKISLSDKE